MNVYDKRNADPAQRLMENNRVVLSVKRTPAKKYLSQSVGQTVQAPPNLTNFSSTPIGRGSPSSAPSYSFKASNTFGSGTPSILNLNGFGAQTPAARNQVDVDVGNNATPEKDHEGDIEMDSNPAPGKNERGNFNMGGALAREENAETTSPVKEDEGDVVMDDTPAARDQTSNRNPFMGTSASKFLASNPVQIGARAPQGPGLGSFSAPTVHNNPGPNALFSTSNVSASTSAPNTSGVNPTINSGRTLGSSTVVGATPSNTFGLSTIPGATIPSAIQSTGTSPPPTSAPETSQAAAPESAEQDKPPWESEDNFEDDYGTSPEF